jgi:hypothetical protein
VDSTEVSVPSSFLLVSLPGADTPVPRLFVRPGRRLPNVGITECGTLSCLGICFLTCMDWELNLACAFFCCSIISLSANVVVHIHDIHTHTHTHIYIYVLYYIIHLNLHICMYVCMFIIMIIGLHRRVPRAQCRCSIYHTAKKLYPRELGKGPRKLRDSRACKSITGLRAGGRGRTST